MGVAINEAGGDDVAFSVNRLLRAVANAANRSDFPIHDTHIGAEPGHARAINDGPIFNNQIVLHSLSFFWNGWQPERLFLL